MKKYEVENMASLRSGNPVANQFIIHDYEHDRIIFQSYSTTIAIKDLKNNVVILDENALDYSRTTSKYLYAFLECNRNIIREGIDNGIFKVKNLN